MVAILTTLLEMGSMSLTSLLRGSPEHYSITGDEFHLTVKGSPGFVVEFNTYKIFIDDPMSFISL